MASSHNPENFQNSPDGNVELPQVAPDFAEQELAESLDNIIPSYGYQMTPMVGLGGSAGALKGLEVFFKTVPVNTGWVFVVVLHLSPDHPSASIDLISKWTTMPVMVGENGIEAKPNCIYVIPPGKHLLAINGHFALTDLEPEQGKRLAIDLFFRCLADTHGPHAVGVILSGASNDGALGLKRIKERGGLTIAQEPLEAEHDYMPRAAINTSMVDWVLPVRDIANRLIDYFNREKIVELPPEEGPTPSTPAPASLLDSESTFREILVFLRMRTGRDFSYYKRATILRRISRRMQINEVSDMLSYLACLRTHPGEAGALLKDLLISVTNFFRDRDAFAKVENCIEQLFTGKTGSDSVRLWVPACATGEEAYSMAILLLEHARKLDDPPAIQVFGCDLDESAIQTARIGLFPESIKSDVSEERLRNFFIKEHGGYRVRREVREMVIFAVHDLLKDAPFSRIDLISCRNLLIYLNRDAQGRVLDILHFALKPNGVLFLGSSESVDETNSLFKIVDKKARIYQKKSVPRLGLPVPYGPSTLLIQRLEKEISPEPTEKVPAQVVIPAINTSRMPPLVASTPGNQSEGNDSRISWGELHFKLIEKFGHPSILINQYYDIQHLSESSGRFLQFIGGEPTTNLLRLANPSLRSDLRAALFRASQTGKPAEAVRIPMILDGETKLIDLAVIPANELAPEHYLVSFAINTGDHAPAEQPQYALEEKSIVQQLETQLEQMKLQLRDTIEQYEASTEELKASNEELQAMNEELCSATEELETSREELQSINEELTTVNHELKSKVEELGHVNSDLNNLMGATAIATVFLDRNMNVMRFTHSAAPIFNLISTDVGRQLKHLQHHIDYPNMTGDAQHVLSTLAPLEREVAGAGNRWYLARMLPYRTVDDRIAGVVLTFVDITERQRTLEELTRFNIAAVGRENKMIELKKEINDLLSRLGEPPRYSLDFLKQ